MSVIENIKRIFKKPEPKVNPNPDIILNFCSEKQGGKHALMVTNSGEYKVEEEDVSTRRVYTAYARDIDQVNLDEDEQMEELDKEYDIIVPKGFFAIFGKGEWSQHNSIIMIFPNNPDELPECFKAGEGTFIRDYIINRQIERTFIQSLIRGDIESSKLYDETMSLVTESLKATLKEQSERYTNLIRKYSSQAKDEQAKI